MIRVLIVDDDKLVRKGLRSAMPWADFGMVVVGEANNGENALKFLAAEKVDLLITDLSMPVMSGIELMREVCVLYPAVKVVVLTLHQDFEYIQEALRLGAIDYIAKVQLEKEQFEEVLGRIASLLKQRTPATERAPLPDDTLDEDELLVWFAMNPAGERAPPESAADDLIEADIGIWRRKSAGAAQSEARVGPGFACVRFGGMQGLGWNKALQFLRSYRAKNLFYDYDPFADCLYVSYDEGLLAESASPASSSAATGVVKERWAAPEWIHDDEIFGRMLEELKSLRLPPVRLTGLFLSLTDEWNRNFAHALSREIVFEDDLSSWFQFVSRIADTRTAIRDAVHKPLYSVEIQNSIIKAMSLARQKLHEPIMAEDIAQQVNMSSSYFSQCFKHIVGQTYTNYLRHIRIEKAKEYLRNTAWNIQTIAEKVGYIDEKYFSRLFREQTGLLPSEYRGKPALLPTGKVEVHPKKG